MGTRNLFRLFLIGLANLKLHAQAPAWQWVRSGKGNFEEEAYALTTTPTGQIIIGGEFYSSTLDLGSTTLTNPSGSPFSSCAFIAAYDSQGILRWAKKAGTSDPNRLLSLASDAEGNIIAAGAFTGSTISFDNFTLTNAGYSDAFVVKYDSTGQVRWALSIGGHSWEYAQSVATDSAGNIYLTGRFDSPTLTLGSFTLTNAGPGESDIFLAKLSPQGQVLWAYSFGGPATEGGQAIAVSPTGEIALTGFFNSSTLSIGLTTLSNGGQSDIFVAKFDTSGQPLWARKAGGTDGELPYGIAFTRDGQIVVAGTYWSDVLTFDTQNLPNQSTGGSNDLFLAKYSASGQLLWARGAGGPDSEEAHAVITDTNGHIYITGHFASPTLSFGGYTLQSSGDADVFVVAYDSAGQPLWTQKAGGSLSERAYAIGMDFQGRLYIAGSYFSNPAVFGSHSISNDQGRDVFVAALGSGANSLPAGSFLSIRLTPLSEAGVYRFEGGGAALPVSWRLYALTGTLISRGVLAASEGVLDFSYLPDGVYLLVMDLPQGSRLWKLLR